MLERYHTRFLRAGAALDEAGTGAARRDRRAARQPRHPVRPERARRRAVLHADSGRGRSRRPAGLRCARQHARPPRSAVSRANTRSPCRARSVEPFLQFSSRRDLREKAFRAWIARGENGGPTDNRALIAEMVACAPSGPSCSAMRPSPITGSTIPWRRRRRRRATCWTRSGAAPARRRPATATPCRRWLPRRAATSRSRRLGLALLRREAAQGAASISTRPRSSRISSSTT